MKECKKDELASNSDDEKHIRKCLKSVNASRAQRRKNSRPRNSLILPNAAFIPNASTRPHVMELRRLFLWRTLLCPLRVAPLWAPVIYVQSTVIIGEHVPLNTPVLVRSDSLFLCLAVIPQSPIRNQLNNCLVSSNVLSDAWFNDVPSSVFPLGYVDGCDYLEHNAAVAGSVRGRLTKCKQWWFDNLYLSNFVISILEYGYKIPLAVEPPMCKLKNNASALDNSQFVIKAIEDLLKFTCVTEYAVQPHCCNPLTVVEVKKRLVLDLSRSVNPYVVVNKF